MAPTDTIAAVMTKDPVVLESDSLLTDAARVMRDSDIGDVIVIESGSVCGIVTDRDIVVRGIASGKDLPPPGLATYAARMSPRCPQTRPWRRLCD